MANAKTSVAFKKQVVDPLFYMLTAISVLCAFLIAVRETQSDYIQYRFLLWNLFLAWLPLVVSMVAVGFARFARGTFLAAGLTCLGVAWLLLYPNAPYLTTDLIHLIYNPRYQNYNIESMLLWYDLVLFFLFSWCGLMLCYLSMRQFHAIVTHYLSVTTGWLFVLVVTFLGGFGVYLGRVVRLNSWDALFNPFRLIAGILEGINSNAFIFTLLFGGLILIVYLTIYVIGINRAAFKRDAE